MLDDVDNPPLQPAKAPPAAPVVHGGTNKSNKKSNSRAGKKANKQVPKAPPAPLSMSSDDSSTSDEEKIEPVMIKVQGGGPPPPRKVANETPKQVKPQNKKASRNSNFGPPKVASHNQEALQKLNMEIEAVRQQFENAKANDDFELCIQLRDKLKNLEQSVIQKKSNDTADEQRQRLKYKLEILMRNQEEANSFVTDYPMARDSVAQQDGVAHVDQLSKIVEQRKLARQQQIRTEQTESAAALETTSSVFRQQTMEISGVVSNFLQRVSELEAKTAITSEHHALDQSVTAKLSALQDMCNRPIEQPLTTDINDVTDDIQFLSSILG